MVALWLTMTTVAYAAKYTYDDLNRLIKVAYDSGQIVNYSYDAGGNMLMVGNEMPVVDTDSDGIEDNVDTDDDNDGMPDAFELAQGFNPLDATDVDSDADNDGYTNVVEYQASTDPNDAQSLPTQPAHSGVWYVNSSTSNSGNGKNWSQAFKTIQEAIAQAMPENEIWVKQGTYTLSSSITIDDYEERYVGLGIYGGFNGSETSRNQRNWTENPTIIEDGIFYFGESSDIIVDGFIINNTKIESVSGVLQVANCAFDKSNVAAVWGRDITITNSLFDNNDDTSITVNSAKATINDSIFSNNGNGINSMINSTVVINRSEFYRNGKGILNEKAS